MQYRKDKYGNDLSVLGFGCMRFPQKLGRIDMDETEKQLCAAIEGGVNYLDTAYIYPGSEAAVGKILESNHLRDRVYIATKLPHYLLKDRAQAEKLFQEELRRLRTDHIDYYLMHMLTDPQAWQRLEQMGIREWIEEKKASGAIRQIGFSYHGNSDTFCKLVDIYHWDFCQIQYNYMDEHSQAGRRGLDYAAAKGLPVIIMEPLRGGKLVKGLPREAEKLCADRLEGYTPAGWARRWLWDQEKVTVVLSGMNSMEMLRENMDTAENTLPGEMTGEQQAFLQQVVKAINAKMKVGCTGCGYCMPCPKGVDIPGTFAAYNRRYQEGKFAGLREYFMGTATRKCSAAASNCVGCGKCEKHCPQGLPIRQHLKSAQKELEGPIYKIARKCVTWFTHF